MPDKSDPKEKTDRATNVFVSRDKRGPVRLWRGLSKGHKVTVIFIFALLVIILAIGVFVLLRDKPSQEPPQIQTPEREPEWSQVFEYKFEDEE